MHFTTTLSVLTVAAALTSGLVGAQPVPAGATVYASGLDGPRGLVFGPDGLLYVAEAGKAGNQSPPANCEAVSPPVGPYKGGLTARISRIAADGSRSTVIDGLASAMNSIPSGDTVGVAAVAFVGDDLYAVLAGGGCSHGNPNAPNAVLRINRTAGTAQSILDLSQYFRDHPVSHPFAGDFEPDGMPYGMKAIGRDLFLVESNHGRLLRINPANGRVELGVDLSAPIGHIVPTSVAAFGDVLLIGMLGEFPIVPGSARLYHVAKDGCVLDYWTGFTTIIDVQVDSEDRIYILEFSSAAGFPTPGAGRILRISGNVVEEIVTDLIVPTAMVVGPDGAIYVSDLGAAPAGAGRILRIANPASGRKLSEVTRVAESCATCRQR
jgi:hypothetical protein